MGTCTFQNRTAKGSESTCIRSNFCLNAHDLTVFITAHGEIHNKVMTLWMYQERLCSCKAYFYSTACAVGHQCSVMLNGHILFAAETAAN